MLSESEINALLAEESESIEWKETPREDSFGEAVCAFANDLHGSNGISYLVFGVRPDGSLTGKAFSDDDSQRLASWQGSGKLVPPVIVNIEIVRRQDGDLLVAGVLPSNYPPVRFGNRVYIRIGTTTRAAEPHHEVVLIERRRALAPAPDLLPIQDATLDDLDLEYFNREYLPAAVSPEVIAQNRRSTDHQMKALRLLSPDGIPTLTGILVLGRDPRQFIAGAYVQFLRSEGTTITDPILDQRQISGRLSEVLATLDSLVDINIKTATTILESGREHRGADYPKSALMQLLFNAIMHRTYTDSNSPVRLYWFADRIEIQNPGGPFGQVTRENFGSGLTDYRNATLAGAMKTLGWVQQFGYGIQEARRALEANGNPQPEFQAEATGVLVIVRARQ